MNTSANYFFNAFIIGIDYMANCFGLYIYIWISFYFLGGKIVNCSKGFIFVKELLFVIEYLVILLVKSKVI